MTLEPVERPRRPRRWLTAVLWVLYLAAAIAFLRWLDANVVWNW